MTEFEEQVLIATITYCELNGVSTTYSARIHGQGKLLFGKKWGGRIRTSKQLYQYAPTISFALGRLARDGYVRGAGSPLSWSIGSVAKAWTPTKAGIDTVGGMDALLESFSLA